jgi:glutamate dehydrogenase (NADP+)
MDADKCSTDEALRRFRARNPRLPKLNQAVAEFLSAIMPVYAANREYQEARVLDRLLEPDRIIRFRVAWMVAQSRRQFIGGWRVHQS